MGKGGQGWWQGTKIGAGPVRSKRERDGCSCITAFPLRATVLSIASVLRFLDIDEPSRFSTEPVTISSLRRRRTRQPVSFQTLYFLVQCLCDAESSRLAVYYGAADTCTAVAFAHVMNFLIISRTIQMSSEEFRIFGQRRVITHLLQPMAH